MLTHCPEGARNNPSGDYQYPMRIKREIRPVGLRIDRVELKRNPVGLKEICPVGLRIDRVEIGKKSSGIEL